MRPFWFWVFPLFVGIPLQAATRTSANYSIITEVFDGGGSSASSTLYANSGSMGGATGISSVTMPSEIAKNGYIGQLYEVTGLTISSPQQSINEEATVQLNAAQLLDDATVLPVPMDAVMWSSSNNAVASISSGGVLTAFDVNQATSVDIEGIYQGSSFVLPLTILSTPTTETPVMPPWMLAMLAILLFLASTRTLRLPARTSAFKF